MKYKFEAWIHPRTGDDYAIIGSIVCSTQETAYKHIKKILKREKSMILTDFTISVIPE